MDEKVYAEGYDTAGNYNWTGVNSGEHVYRFNDAVMTGPISTSEHRDILTNKEWMATLTSEQCYDVMWWLFKSYSLRWTHSQMAIIDWLDQEHKSAAESEPFNPPHNN